jgi:hypothetical protein
MGYYPSFGLSTICSRLELISHPTSAKTKLGAAAESVPGLKQDILDDPTWMTGDLFDKHGKLCGHKLLVYKLPDWLEVKVNRLCLKEFNMTRKALRKLEFRLRDWANTTIHDIAITLELLRNMDGGVDAHLLWIGFSRRLIDGMFQTHYIGGRLHVPCPRNPLHGSLPPVWDGDRWCAGCCGAHYGV